MTQTEKAEELADFLNTLLPHDHKIEFATHTTGKLEWPDGFVMPERASEDGEGYYLFWGHSPRTELHMAATAHAVETLPPVAIWEVTKKVFPISAGSPNQIMIWRNGDRAELE